MAEEKQNDVEMIIHVGLNKNNNVIVSGPIGDKKMCIDLLSHAILIINGLKPKKSPIIMPSMVPGISN